MPKYSTNTKTDVLIHLAIIVSIVLVLFFGFFFVYLPWSTNHGDAVKVPNLKGLSMDAAEDLLDDADLDYEISDSVFVSGAEPLSIIANYPKSGANVKTGRKIYLTVAAVSAPLVKLPNIIGRSTSSAQNQLLSSGLLYEGEEKIAALEENTVLAVKINGREIQQGDEIPKGSKITFVVGDGYGNQRIDVPNVVGMAQDEADILVTGLGLTIGNVTFEVSDKPAGTVIRQQPSSGVDEKIKIGSPVNIWVSGEAPDNTIDN
ncbi:PASTA domain-containing protein [Lacihabitans sp. CCS-44]|uniref:PASTA domain-containing protein n=1 Tax=Lacihabitans sp. CCS-44 TaxID=2487331 RepID=UPI0020CBF9C0|nr:PASTA domain-containing protein [Lacihabitans sp. CCS-44]MCP9754175.1 PASTA domain-containing protein [Lacihabitans sp. CCS-44]